MTGCRQCFGNHDVCVMRLWNRTLDIKYNYCRGRMSCYAKCSFTEDGRDLKIAGMLVVCKAYCADQIQISSIM